MPKFHQFNGFQLDVRSGDHNPPHFHVISPDFHAMVRIDSLTLLRGEITGRAFREVVEWASTHREELMIEWRRLNERD